MAQVTILQATLDGDAVTVTGIVDGQATMILTWKSYLDTLPNRAAKVNFVAGLLKASIHVPLLVDILGTVTV